MCFFFKQNTAYEMRIRDWSSDVCSSDLDARGSDDQRAAKAVMGDQQDGDGHACKLAESGASGSGQTVPYRFIPCDSNADINASARSEWNCNSLGEARPATPTSITARLRNRICTVFVPPANKT